MNKPFYAQYFEQEEKYKASIIYPELKDVEHRTARWLELNKHAVLSGSLFLKSVSITQILIDIKLRNKTGLLRKVLDLGTQKN